MRLFIGIDLPIEIKQRLLELQSDLRKAGAVGSWKSRDSFHITLEFLGELEADCIPTLTSALTEAARSHNPFSLGIEGLGAFPSFERPHTLWSAINGNLNALHNLRDDIQRELAEKGFDLENRRFKPHITLASRPNLNNIDAMGIKDKILGEFTVNEVILFESRAVSGKRVYTDLFKISLD